MPLSAPRQPVTGTAARLPNAGDQPCDTPSLPSLPPPPSWSARPAPAAAADIVHIPAGETRLASLIRAEHVRFCGTSLTLVGQHVALDRWRAKDMLARNYFSHTIPGGTYYWDHFRRFGIEDWFSPNASEIIATNIHMASDNDAAAYAYRQFMDSAAHRGAIRNCALNAFGVGAYREGSRRDFAVTFSRQPTERTTGSTASAPAPAPATTRH